MGKIHESTIVNEFIKLLFITYLAKYVPAFSINNDHNYYYFQLTYHWHILSVFTYMSNWAAEEAWRVHDSEVLDGGEEDQQRAG